MILTHTKHESTFLLIKGAFIGHRVESLDGLEVIASSDRFQDIYDLARRSHYYNDMDRQWEPIHPLVLSGPEHADPANVGKKCRFLHGDVEYIGTIVGIDKAYKVSWKQCDNPHAEEGHFTPGSGGNQTHVPACFVLEVL